MSEREKPRFTVQVELQVLKTEHHVLIVLDEADMKKQIAEREALLKSTPYVAKPQRDKKGVLIMHQLNKDWNV